MGCDWGVDNMSGMINQGIYASHRLTLAGITSRKATSWYDAKDILSNTIVQPELGVAPAVVVPAEFALATSWYDAKDIG